ncbi:hypothetical protein M408DRAFT_241714 [Serendipita vermifera MAFF 305830]|uniref:RRM domain-containing protein n=1 Tax=Serendipita vermifera MAFF 305830 TaxID=933852 RepID=A0A0C3BKI0_SERVB|nr:hypothetical protein M408DRAFT_241714 [Serendipita vermifera MAFF 305830]
MATVKLTKKQQKAAAFRGKKGNSRAEPQDVPLVDELGVDDGVDQDGIEPPVSNAVKTAQVPSENKSKKRKREEDVTGSEPPSNKRVKLPATVEDAQSTKPKEQKQKTVPKYILFVGNLSYKTTTEAIAEHFSACDPPPTIRRLTSRNKGPNTKPEKSKGCAFLEFTKASGLQTALRLHHSELDGRQINVELSAGGGGKSDARIKKLKEKNAKLDKHRADASAKLEGLDEENNDQGTLKPAKGRYSSTAGTESTPQHKPTWSVPRAGEAAGRGGQKHKKPSGKGPKRQNGRERRSNDWTMSGANAIPVG